MSKADSLLLTQTCRLFLIPDNKQVNYWLGLYIREYFPDMGQGPYAEIISPYFLHMKSLLVGGLVLGEIQATGLKKTTAKVLYAEIEYKFDIDWSQVW